MDWSKIKRKRPGPARAPGVYADLEELIRQRPPAHPIKTSDLSIPRRVYEWRKNHTESASQEQLDRINDAIFAGDLDTARMLVKTFEASLTN